MNDKLKQVFLDDPEMLKLLEQKEQTRLLKELAAKNNEVKIQGVASLKGDRGEKGDQGESGQDGIDGVDGLDGKSGKNGRDGKDGKPGKDGEQGLKGDKGDPGEDGVANLDDVVKALKEGKLLELRDIKGARLDMNDQRWHGGGISNITGLIQAGTNITITGDGTKTLPYIINATGTGLTGIPNTVVYFNAAGTPISDIGFKRTGTNFNSTLIQSLNGSNGGQLVIDSVGSSLFQSVSGVTSLLNLTATSSSLSTSDGVTNSSLTLTTGFSQLKFVNLSGLISGVTFADTQMEIRNAGVIWNWPTVDASGFLKSNGSGTLSFSAIPNPFLTSTQVAFGDASNLMTSSTDYTYDTIGGSYTMYLNGFGMRQRMTGGQFIVDNGGANPILRVGVSTGIVELGDVGGSLNGTSLIVDDTSQKYTLSKLATGGATQIVTANSTGILGITPFSPSLIVGTPTQIAFFDPITGELTSDSSMVHDPGSNVLLSVQGTNNIIIGSTTGSLQTDIILASQAGNATFWEANDSSITTNGRFQLYDSSQTIAPLIELTDNSTYDAKVRLTSTGVSSLFNNIAGSQLSELNLTNVAQLRRTDSLTGFVSEIIMNGSNMTNQLSDGAVTFIAAQQFTNSAIVTQFIDPIGGISSQISQTAGTFEATYTDSMTFSNQLTMLSSGTRVQFSDIAGNVQAYTQWDINGINNIATDGATTYISQFDAGPTSFFASYTDIVGSRNASVSVDATQFNGGWSDSGTFIQGNIIIKQTGSSLDYKDNVSNLLTKLDLSSSAGVLSTDDSAGANTYSAVIFANSSGSKIQYTDVTGGNISNVTVSLGQVNIGTSDSVTYNADTVYSSSGVISSFTNIGTGDVTSIKISDLTYTLNKLAGSGSGLVGVDNSGVLGFISGNPLPPIEQGISYGDNVFLSSPADVEVGFIGGSGTVLVKIIETDFKIGDMIIVSDAGCACSGNNITIDANTGNFIIDTITGGAQTFVMATDGEVIYLRLIDITTGVYTWKVQ